MVENLFSVDEQTEIVKIVKGIICYAKQNKNVMTSEYLLLELIEKSCNNVMLVIKDRNKNECN